MSSPPTTTRILADHTDNRQKLPAFFRILIIVFTAIIFRFIIVIFFYDGVSGLKENDYYPSFLFMGIAFCTIISTIVGTVSGFALTNAIDGTPQQKLTAKHFINPFWGHLNTEDQHEPLENQNANSDTSENKKLSKKRGKKQSDPELQQDSDTELKEQREQEEQKEQEDRPTFTRLVLIGFMLYFVLYLPLDFLFNLIPGILEFQAQSISTSPGGEFYAASFDIFIVNLLIVHICVGTWEEIFFRYFLGNVHRIEADKKTGLLSTSICFGLVHFYYIFKFPEYPVFSIIWGFAAFIISIISISVFYKYNSIIPVIIGHALNNIVGGYALRLTLLGETLTAVFTNCYLIFIIIGIVILIAFFKPIKMELTGLGQYIKKTIKMKSKMPVYQIVILAIFVSLISSLFV